MVRLGWVFGSSKCDRVQAGRCHFVPIRGRLLPFCCPPGRRAFGLSQYVDGRRLPSVPLLLIAQCEARVTNRRIAASRLYERGLGVKGDGRGWSGVAAGVVVSSCAHVSIAAPVCAASSSSSAQTDEQGGHLVPPRRPAPRETFSRPPPQVTRAQQTRSRRGCVANLRTEDDAPSGGGGDQLARCDRGQATFGGGLAAA